MKRLFFVSIAFFISISLTAQSVSFSLAAAFNRFELDSQLKSAISSLYVINAKTGAVVFAKNETMGLATASTLKIITAATAYELLGKDFRYKTDFGYKGKMVGQAMVADLYINPSGDPTLGSWRWEATKDDAAINRILADLKKTSIKSYRNILVNHEGWDNETIPDGWMWQDIGNYYGAGASAFNWRENQYDIILKSKDKIGSEVEIVGTKPKLLTFSVGSKVTAGPKGSGDNSYVYYPLNTRQPIVRGTIPVNEKGFTISAANPDAEGEFMQRLMEEMKVKNEMSYKNFDTSAGTAITIFHSEYSPPLDSIVYWFLKKSINLYGEALTKTIAYKKEGEGSTDKGVEVIKDFWSSKGIAKTEMNIVDGSGLSPLNRVTTHAQVVVLKYAKKQPWFSGYYYGFPDYNGMKMKSGTINGVKGFAGYHTAKNGEEYIYSFLVNNYNGPASALVQKMYLVLNVLK